ncbi:MAG: ATP-binding cassette domain-containing protein [Spirochaetaceae bacterium]|jgi:ABC-2 type transport system ATP-binding protein|nr:ATP-binding cassette domain-containing protein [Spirochaetaceae bacterium]
MGEYVLRTKELSKKYEGVYAIENINVEIKQGQIYGLIGLNGAGKSTFMRAVAGLIALSSGEVELFGKSTAKALRHGRERIGQSIETPAVYPAMTAEQNLEIQRKIGKVADKKTSQETLELVGLGDTEKKKVKDFSLGMRQRLALAIALITKPEFLILDEPVNGLDPLGIIEIRELIRRLAQEQGLTFLVSSHLLDELAQVATHYGIIDKGRLVKQISQEELAYESRQYIKITTDDSRKAALLIKEKLGETEIKETAKNELCVYGHTEKTGKINTLLVTNGVTVENISVFQQRLEDYFVNLTESRK